MTLFQWISLSFLAGLVLVELWQAVRNSSLRHVWWLRVVVWLVTAAAIARPEWITDLALTLGIQRGADLVTYGAVLLLLITSLYFYARYLRLQQQITVLTRRLAQLEARPCPPQPGSEQRSEAKTPQRGDFATAQPEETA
ncbi:MAG: DUF2304 domain-containing protein [Planctomycetes bacterium]|nr:DUF2304 domain-containing protein [Planctomycetota bacterium]